MKEFGIVIFVLVGLVVLSGKLIAKEEVMDEKWAVATFAGGCFWCMEPPYDKLEGVKETIVGYMGGHTKNPTYQEVSAGTTGHAEVIQVVYDPSVVSYEKLVDTFWRNINPIQVEGQFADTGTQYRTAIFYHDEEQKKIAEASKKALEESGKYQQPIATEVVPATEFYRGEEYHQNYYQKNSTHYQIYSVGSGRKDYLKKMWDKK